jgi:hypothetical protein
MRWLEITHAGTLETAIAVLLIIAIVKTREIAIAVDQQIVMAWAMVETFLVNALIITFIVARLYILAIADLLNIAHVGGRIRFVLPAFPKPLEPWITIKKLPSW